MYMFYNIDRKYTIIYGICVIFFTIYVRRNETKLKRWTLLICQSSFLEEQPYSSDVSNAITAAPAPTQNDQPKRQAWSLSKDSPAFFSFDDLIPYTATAIPMLKTAKMKNIFIALRNILPISIIFIVSCTCSTFLIFVLSSIIIDDVIHLVII